MEYFFCAEFSNDPDVCFQFRAYLSAVPSSVAYVESDFVWFYQVVFNHSFKSVDVATPIESAHDFMRIRNHLTYGVDEENSVGFNGTAKIDFGIELRKTHDEVVERHFEPFVDDDAETAFFVVIDD